MRTWLSAGEGSPSAGGTDGDPWPAPWATQAAGPTPGVASMHSGKLQLKALTSSSSRIFAQYPLDMNPACWEMGWRVTPITTTWQTAATVWVYGGLCPLNPTFDASSQVSPKNSICLRFTNTASQLVEQVDSGGTHTTIWTQSTSMASAGLNPIVCTLRVVYPYVMARMYIETVTGPTVLTQQTTQLTLDLGSSPMCPFLRVDLNSTTTRDMDFDQLYVDDLAA